jgi:hypothetical protein
VTLHALRRFGDRICGLEDQLAGFDDLDAVDAMQAAGIEVGRIRDWLAFYGGVGARHGAAAVCRDGVGIVLQGDRVVTVLSRRGIRR